MKKLRINRKKMETEKWAVKRWCEIGDAFAELYSKRRWNTPFFVGHIRSEIENILCDKEERYLEKKMRQIYLVLDKIGFNYKPVENDRMYIGGH